MSSDKMNDSLSSDWEFIQDDSESFESFESLLDSDSDALSALFEKMCEEQPGRSKATVRGLTTYPRVGSPTNVIYPQGHGKCFAPSHFLTLCCFSDTC